MSAAAGNFPWRRAMELGLGQLGWPPQAFWHATLRELAAALGDAPRAIDRAGLESLMARYPD